MAEAIVMTKKNPGFISLAIVAVLLVGSASSAGAQSSDTLYKRLGGYDAIAAVTDEFIVRLVTDKKLSRFFTGTSTDSKKRIRQMVVEQLCAAAGGPCIYVGRDMKTSHSGLGITEEDWKTAVDHLVATLNKFKVGKKEQDELLGALSSLKGDIVEKK
jgi:hemoglobin